MAARQGVQKISMLRKAWHEMPDLVASLGISVLALGVGSLVIYDVRRKGDKEYIYKKAYTVIRDTDVDDPKKLGDLYN